MRPSVYIETSIIGHLTSRLPSNSIVAAQMQETRRWWNAERLTFEVFISDFVIQEISQGDPAAAAERINAVSGLPFAPVTPPAIELAAALIVAHALPSKARVDAAHIATAAANSIEYLLTWNCKHLANATLWPKIETICRQFGYNAPIICTPEQLPEVKP